MIKNGLVIMNFDPVFDRRNFRHPASLFQPFIGILLRVHVNYRIK
jgi:hypothetical protein